jgi:hypothetical protein
VWRRGGGGGGVTWQAIRINPEHRDSLSHYGTFLGKVHHNYAAANVLYDRVLKIDPLHVNTICNKGLVLQVSALFALVHVRSDVDASCAAKNEARRGAATRLGHAASHRRMHCV